MEDIVLGFGFLLALIGPVLILAVIWIVYRLLLRTIAFRGSFSDERRRLIFFLISTALVVGTLVAS